MLASSFNTGEPASSKGVVSAEAFDRNRQELLAPLAAQPGLAAIWSVLESLATQFKDDPVIRAAVRPQNESSSSDTALPPRYTGWIDTFTGLYTRAASDGSLRPRLDPATPARLTVATFFGIHPLRAVMPRIRGRVTGRAGPVLLGRACRG
ncbi:hypothetical protein [Nonomuraea aurantiaca]|uniref:hypothetical protein n=1 Tax=Nonomuraea aurantiaca TaxID=2878562 RepID=UPI001CDA417F|nr:hypothetical protein [Nonomuraea aurantiaca]MCA2228258.1 hypothetical protein [Nonomuraea aurantiaca]